MTVFNIWLLDCFWHCVFQAYGTVTSAAEGKDPDSEEYGQVDELKQYPFIYKLATLMIRFS